MLWLPIAILCACIYAITHIVVKKTVHDQSPSYIVFLKIILTAIISLPFVVFFWNKLEINKIFLFSMFLSAFIVIIAQTCYMKSLKLSSISKSVPLLSLSPLFALPLGIFMVGELPGIIGIIGIILIVIGAYILNIKLSKRNILSPFTHLFEEKGYRYMLLAAAVYGFGSILDKFILNHSNFLSLFLLYAYFVIPVQGAFLLFRDKREFFAKIKKTFYETYKYILIIVLLGFAALGTQLAAMTLTYAVYVVAAKRASAIISLILAFFLFKERENFISSLAGTITLVVGIILLIL